jgi:hypothetical protein
MQHVSNVNYRIRSVDEIEWPSSRKLERQPGIVDRFDRQPLEGTLQFIEVGWLHEVRDESVRLGFCVFDGSNRLTVLRRLWGQVSGGPRA